MPIVLALLAGFSNLLLLSSLFQESGDLHFAFVSSSTFLSFAHVLIPVVFIVWTALSIALTTLAYLLLKDNSRRAWVLLLLAVLTLAPFVRSGHSWKNLGSNFLPSSATLQRRANINTLLEAIQEGPIEKLEPILKIIEDEEIGRFKRPNRLNPRACAELFLKFARDPQFGLTASGSRSIDARQLKCFAFSSIYFTFLNFSEKRGPAHQCVHVLNYKIAHILDQLSYTCSPLPLPQLDNFVCPEAQKRGLQFTECSPGAAKK